jgi:putative endonuclease
MYSVYILYSGLLSKYYIGQTSDFAARLLQHNTGESTYTSKGIPWEAILVIEVAS